MGGNRQWPLAWLAEHLGARLEGGVPTHEVRALAPLATATEGDLSFFTHRRHLDDLRATRAGAVIVTPEHVELCPVAALVHPRPYVAYARASALMAVPHEIAPPGENLSAVVEDGAEVHPDAGIGPHAYIGPGARVGARAQVGPGCVVEAGASIGDDTRLVANVVVCRGVQVGERCLVHPGVVIGADGFGLAKEEGRWIKIEQLGSVRIGAEVEIGANTTIDRGALRDTVIGDRVKIDNQVQIAHNVIIGDDTAIAGSVAIAGSARIGARCEIGGAAMISGHLDIADEVRVTGGSAVAASITERGSWSSGMPAQKSRAWGRMWVRMQQLDELAHRLERLEQRADARDEAASAAGTAPKEQERQRDE